MSSIDDIRQANINLLVNQEVAAGATTSRAKALFAVRIGKDAAQVRQWLYAQDSQNYRRLSSEMARHIEQACGLAKGWLDVSHAAAAEQLVVGSDVRRSTEVARYTGAVENNLAVPGNLVVPHLGRFDNEAGPGTLVFPEAMIREVAHLHDEDRLAWIVNPTDSMGDLIPKGMIAFVDTSVKTVRGNGTYAVRLFGDPSIMRVQVRGEGELRVTGSNRFDDAIDLFGDQAKSLEIGGLIVGFVDRIRLI